MQGARKRLGNTATAIREIVRGCTSSTSTRETTEKPISKNRTGPERGPSYHAPLIVNSDSSSDSSFFPTQASYGNVRNVALAVCKTSSIAFPDARSVYFMSLQRARTVHGLILHFQMSRSDRTTPYSPCTNARLIHMTWRPLHAATHKSPPRVFRALFTLAMRDTLF